MKMAIITADVNDGDYISEIHTELKKKDICLLVKVGNAIKHVEKTLKGNNWGDDEYVFAIYEDELTKKEIRKFMNFVPYHDNWGKTHTIYKIEIFNVKSTIYSM